MNRYLFFVNAEYCYPILKPLQNIILSKGGTVAWFIYGSSTAPLSKNDFILSTTKSVNDFDPHAVITPSDWIPYYFPGKKVQIFHGLARNKRGAENEISSDHYTIRGWFDLYCTMSKKDTDIFTDLSKKYRNFHVVKTGWPKLDPFFQKIDSLPVNHQSSIPIVFFASTFSRSITAAPILVDEIERLCKSGKWKFIVTLHPKMSPAVISRYKSIKHINFLYIDSSNDLLEHMFKSDIMLCDTSSIMYEYLFLNKPLVTFRTMNPGPYLTNVEHIADIESALILALSRPDQKLYASKKLCNELHELHDGMSSDRVLEAVDSLIDGKLGELSQKPLNLIRKIKVRLRLLRNNLPVFNGDQL
jgi:CDP-glycerol glycerophosphotransferase (TagB/SpsB family)